MKKMSLHHINTNLMSNNPDFQIMGLEHTLRFLEFLNPTELFNSIPLFAQFLHNEEWTKKHPDEQELAAHILIQIAEFYSKDPRSSEALLYIITTLQHSDKIAEYANALLVAHGIPEPDVTKVGVLSRSQRRLMVVIVSRKAKEQFRSWLLQGRSIYSFYCGNRQVF